MSSPTERPAPKPCISKIPDALRNRVVKEIIEKYVAENWTPAGNMPVPLDMIVGDVDMKTGLIKLRSKHGLVLTQKIRRDLDDKAARQKEIRNKLGLFCECGAEDEHRADINLPCGHMFLLEHIYSDDMDVNNPSCPICSAKSEHSA